MSNKAKLLEGIKNKPVTNLSREDRSDLGNGLRSPKSTFRKRLYVVDATDEEWLKETVSSLKPTRRKTNQSELVRLGLAVLKEKSQDELTQLLRNLE